MRVLRRAVLGGLASDYYRAASVSSAAACRGTKPAGPASLRLTTCTNTWAAAAEKLVMVRAWYPNRAAHNGLNQ